MAASKRGVPGFVTLSDQVFTRKADSEPKDVPPEHPHAVIIFGWGDGLPKHVLKYADGYKTLYPTADQVIVLSPISKAVFLDLNTRSTAMKPLIDFVFGPEGACNNKDSRVLLHCMSNGGGINCASALNEYRAQFGQPMPHQLLVLDSTPGSPYLSFAVLEKWSRAMAMGAAGYFPWPFFMTQGLCAVFLAAHRGYERIIGRESASIFSCNAINDDSFVEQSAQRLYLYSKEDDIIHWEEIEEHAAEAREKGYETGGVVFSGSGHVGHMRMFPEKYWASIQHAWKGVVEEDEK